MRVIRSYWEYSDGVYLYLVIQRFNKRVWFLKGTKEAQTVLWERVTVLKPFRDKLS